MLIKRRVALQALLDAGVLPGGDMTVEAALMKLSYVLGKEDWSLEKKREVTAWLINIWPLFDYVIIPLQFSVLICSNSISKQAIVFPV